MTAAPLGKAYIEVRADLGAFPAELKAKLKAAFAEATAGLEFPQIEERAKVDGERAGEVLADEMEKAVEPKSKESGEKSGKSFVSGFAKVLPMLGAAALPTLIGLGVEVAAALAPAALALGATIPAALTSLVAVTGTLKIAFSGVGTALAAAFSGDPAKMAAAMQKLAPAAQAVVKEINSLSGGLKQFKIDVQQAFFVELEGSIKRLITTLLPTLRAGMVGLSSDLGKVGAAITNSLASSKGDIAKIFANTRAALAPILEQLPRLVSMFLKLAAAAGPFATVLSQGVGKALGDMITKVDKLISSGGINELFSTGLAVLRSFGGALSQIFDLVGTIFRALGQSGGQALGVIGEIAKILNDFFSSAAGKQALIVLFQLLNVVLSSLAQIIQPLLPYIAKLVSAFGVQLVNSIIVLTPALSKLVSDLAPLLGALVPLAPVITVVATALSQIITMLAQHPALIQTALAAWGAYKAAMYAVAIAEALVDALDPAGWVILAVVAIAAGAALIIANWNTVKHWAVVAWDAIKGAGEAVWNWLKGAATSVGNFFSGVVTWFQELPGRIWNFIMGIPAMIGNLFQQALQAAAYAVGFGIGLIIGGIIRLPGMIWSALMGLGALLSSLFTQAWDWVVNVTTTGVERAVAFVQALPGRLWGILTSLPGLARQAFQNLWNEALNWTRQGIDNLINFAKSLPGRLGNFLANAGSQIVSGLRSAINHIIDSFNNGIDKATGPLHVALPHIPHLSRGDIVTSPTLALLGEQSKPEVVIPLTNPGRARQLAEQSGLTQMLQMATLTPVVNVTVMLGNGQILDVVDQRVDSKMNDQAQAYAFGAR